MTTLGRIEEIFRDALSIEPPATDTDMIAAGLLDSLALVTLLAELEHEFSIRIPLENLDIEGLRTLRRVAALVERNLDEPIAEIAPLMQRRIVLLRPGTDERAVFLVHTITGDALGMRPLAIALDTRRPVYGLQAVGLDPREEPQRRVEEMAATYVRAIRGVQPEGPFALAGSSFGGLVAFEMARILEAEGERIDCLALIDTQAHPASLPALARARFVSVRPWRYLLHTLSDPRTRVPRSARKVLLRVAPRLPIAPPPSAYPQGPGVERLARAAEQAYAAYRPGPYAGRAILFLAERRFPGECNPLEVWSSRIHGGITVRPLPGHHAETIAEPAVGLAAAGMSEILNEAPPLGAAAPLVGMLDSQSPPR